MGFARTCSVALVGVEGVVVEVQADLEPGVAAFTLVGLPDKSLTESRDRVRAAVVFPVKSSMLDLVWRMLPVPTAARWAGLGLLEVSEAGVRRVWKRELPEEVRPHVSPLGVKFLFPARGGVDMVAA
jgi:hypothetical protein